MIKGTDQVACFGVTTSPALCLFICKSPLFLPTVTVDWLSLLWTFSLFGETGNTPHHLESCIWKYVDSHSAPFSLFLAECYTQDPDFAECCTQIEEPLELESLSSKQSCCELRHVKSSTNFRDDCKLAISGHSGLSSSVCACWVDEDQNLMPLGQTAESPKTSFLIVSYDLTGHSVGCREGFRFTVPMQIHISEASP